MLISTLERCSANWRHITSRAYLIRIIFYTVINYGLWTTDGGIIVNGYDRLSNFLCDPSGISSNPSNHVYFLLFTFRCRIQCQLYATLGSK